MFAGLGWGWESKSAGTDKVKVQWPYSSWSIGQLLIALTQVVSL